jgi:hypothetical protein
MAGKKKVYPEYSRCRDCGEVSGVQGQWEAYEKVEISKEEEVALELAGKIFNGVCPKCFDKSLRDVKAWKNI